MYIDSILLIIKNKNSITLNQHIFEIINAIYIYISQKLNGAVCFIF